VRSHDAGSPARAIERYTYARRRGVRGDARAGTARPARAG